jgi:N-dimethylarginine dimethylaminohydrolase
LKTELLMCPPVYIYSHDIDPRFNIYQSQKNNEGEQPDIAGAMQEWTELMQKVIRAGARVHIIEPVEGLGDMQFCANYFWARGGEHTFVLSNQAPHHRRPEREHVAIWLAKRGYRILPLTQEEDGREFEKYLFAGQGMVVTTEQQYFIAHGPRTTLLAIEEIQRELRIEKEIVPLKLPDDGSFYDLDIVFKYSREADAILYYPEAFDKDGLLAIERAKVNHLIEIQNASQLMQEMPDEASWNFRLNAPYIENVEIFPNQGPVSTLPKPIRRLEGLGRYRNIELTTINLPQHGKLGGGARCLLGFLT